MLWAMIHTITITVDSDRPAAELAAVAQDALRDISEGFMGDPDDWHTFTVVEPANA